VFGLHDVGAALQYFGRQTCGEIFQRGNLTEPGRQEIRMYRRAGHERQRIFILSYLAREAGDIHTGRINARLGLAEIKLR